MKAPTLILTELLGEHVPQRAKTLPRSLVFHRAPFKNSQSTIRAMRNDHDRVTPTELEQELKECRLDKWGEQSKAAEICGVLESAMRAWRSGKQMPPRRAIVALREWRSQNSKSLRSVGGAK